MGDFKAIIIGGGPVGMFLANAFQASGTYYVVFEQRPIIPPPTALGIFLWPHVIRLFHQLGLLDKLERIGTPMKSTINSLSTGEFIEKNTNFDLIAKSHGYGTFLLDRGTFAEALLQNLQDPEKHIVTGKRLKNIITSPDKVTAEFADGTAEDGSIVIGADGIWSTVRDLMKKMAPEGLFDENPYNASYQGVFGRGPLLGGIKPGQLIDMHGHGKDLQVFPSDKETHFITYKRIEPSSERTNLRQEGADEHVAPWLDVPIADGVVFGDLWRNKYAGGMANFDEGCVGLWHWDRAVLVGDSAHKMLPNQGTGANNGIESAASLVNQLTTLLKLKPCPKTADLTMAFSAYQAEREGTAMIWTNTARFMLDKLSREEGPLLKAVDTMNRRVAPMIASGIILENIPFEDGKVGRVPWVNKTTRASLEKVPTARL